MTIPTPKQLAARGENEVLRALACLYSAVRRAGLDTSRGMRDYDNMCFEFKNEIANRIRKRKEQK